jgi:predicted nucleotidyltransferase
MDETTLIIQKLPTYVRITGSYARGEQTSNSDLDFYVPEKKWQHFKAWAKENIDGTPSSCIVGHLTWYEPMMMEFADCFSRQKNLAKEITVFGRTFKTW